jgi:hypothetical protein
MRKINGYIESENLPSPLRRRVGDKVSNKSGEDPGITTEPTIYIFIFNSWFVFFFIWDFTLNKTLFHNRETLIHNRETLIHRREALIHNGEALIHRREALIHNRETLIHSRETLIHSRETLIHSRETLIHRRETLFHNKETLLHKSEILFHLFLYFCIQKFITYGRNNPSIHTQLYVCK